MKKSTGNKARTMLKNRTTLRNTTRTKETNDADDAIYSKENFTSDCAGYTFVPTILPAVARLIAIGDIHGDYELAVRSFKLANLIDDKHNWIANPKDTIVVQVGDQIDSCRPIPGLYNCHNKRYDDDRPDDMKVVNFFNDMHAKATKYGGAVHSLLGNHELMNAQGRFDYVSHDNYYNFNYADKNNGTYVGPQGRIAAFQPGGPISSEFACTRQSVLIVGSTMFVHAGVLPILEQELDHLNIDNHDKLRYINAVVRKWLLNKLSKEDIHNKNTIVEYGKKSPFWTRIYGSIPINAGLDSHHCFSSVKRAIEVYKIGRMIVGHTPQLFTNNVGINGTCYEKKGDNKLYRVDGGFAMAFKIIQDHNLTQVLEILNDETFNILTEGGADVGMRTRTTNRDATKDASAHGYASAHGDTHPSARTNKLNKNLTEEEINKIQKIYFQNRATIQN